MSKKKYLLMPDSFKGTMSAIEVCQIMKSSILSHDPDAAIVSIPIADGGEGTVDCFLHAFGGEKIEAEVTGPFRESVTAFYGKSNSTAIIEMAAASGFSSCPEDQMDPSSSTTYGVGQLIKEAVESGCKEIILGLGGSCTNDAGAGMAAALGAVFYDLNGEPFVPVGGNLRKISRISRGSMDALLKDVSVTAMCDIDNPLYGSNGAAFVFAPQKGAGPDMVQILDYNLQCFARRVQADLNIDISTISGGGAAGGMGAGAYAFLGANLKQGIDVILDRLHFEQLTDGPSIIFTGEGQLDPQSLSGKAVVGIARRAKESHIPVIAVVGKIAGDISAVYDAGVTQVFQTDPGTYSSYQELARHCREDLSKTMNQILFR